MTVFNFLPILMILSNSFTVPIEQLGNVPHAHEVIALHLQPNGTYYHVSYSGPVIKNMVNKLDSFVTGEPEVDRILQEIPEVLQDAGLTGIEGLGASVVPIDNGLYSTRIFWKLPAAAQEKLGWQALLGSAPQADALLKYLPEDTAGAIVLNCDTQAIWEFTKEAILRIGFEGDRARFEAELNDLAKEDMSPQLIFDSLTGRAIASLQLNPEKPFPVLFEPQQLMLPSPGFMLVVETRNDRFANEFLKVLQKKNRNTHSTRQIEGYTVDVFSEKQPTPLPFELSCTRVENGFILASTPEIMKNTLQARKQGNNITKSKAFTTVFGNTPPRHRGLVYISPSVAKAYNEMVERSKTMTKQHPEMGILTLFMEKVPETGMGGYVTTDAEGILIKGVGTGKLPKQITSQVPMPYFAIIAAMTLPAINKVQENARKSVCITNLRVIEVAKQQWALENNKPADAIPTMEDLAPYHSGIKECPSGGTYTINPVNKKPTCTVPGHRLP